MINKKGLPHRDKPFIQNYLLSLKHSLVTHHRVAMMMVMQADVSCFSH
jgi:hypothetical protein